jgi:hypothetical protein
MVSSSIKIFVDEREFDFSRHAQATGGKFKLDSETSVSRLKAHFFETLGGLGKVVKFSRADATPGGELACAIASPEALVASFHESPPELVCRLLQHTKGGLMLPGGFLDGWAFRPSTTLLVTSQHQAQRLSAAFRASPLQVFPFYPRVDPEYLTSGDPGTSVPSGESRADLLYAGRWIASKGVGQIARAVDHWRCNVKSFHLVGGFEQGFPISQCAAIHSVYPDFFNREILLRFDSMELTSEPPLPPRLLASRFHHADYLVYPSFHEDENYGLVPREAACCGAIPVVTDFCGLGELGRSASCGIVCTWSTLGGVRYSLRDFSMELQRLVSHSPSQRLVAQLTNRSFVQAECSGADSLKQIAAAIRPLMERPPGPPPQGGWRCSERIENLAATGPATFRKALCQASASTPAGLYVDGTGYYNKRYSEAHLLQAIQGLYTTWPHPPRLRPGVHLHGFWRVGLWRDERALVEFGFPGPRVFRFTATDWKVVQAAARPFGKGDYAFDISNTAAAEALQPAVDLGYLVPHDPMICDLPEPNDTLPSANNFS